MGTEQFLAKIEELTTQTNNLTEALEELLRDMKNYFNSKSKEWQSGNDGRAPGFALESARCNVKEAMSRIKKALVSLNEASETISR